MEKFKDHLLKLGFKHVEENTYIKQMNVIADELLDVTITLYKPVTTVWMYVECKHEFFEEGVLYKGRLRSISFLDELYNNLIYIEC